VDTIIHNPDGTVSYRCFFCGGCAHPSCGHFYTPTVIACRRCTVEAFRNAAGWSNRKGRRRGPAFYDAVVRTRELLTGAPTRVLSA
jgi:hypothetical protein